MKFNKLTRNQINTIRRKGKKFGINVYKQNDTTLNCYLEYLYNETDSTKYINSYVYNRMVQIISVDIEFFPLKYEIRIDAYFVNYDKDYKIMNEKLESIKQFIDWLKEYDEKITNKK